MALLRTGPAKVNPPVAVKGASAMMAVSVTATGEVPICRIVTVIVGVREFWGLELEVTPDVLIPRPATELIIEAVHELFPNRAVPLKIVGRDGSPVRAIGLVG